MLVGGLEYVVLCVSVVRVAVAWVCCRTVQLFCFTVIVNIVAYGWAFGALYGGARSRRHHLFGMAFWELMFVSCDGCWLCNFFMVGFGLSVVLSFAGEGGSV